MIRNYIKIGWRNLIREKEYTLLNIAGLAIGIVCATLIFLYIQYKLDTNRAFAEAENIYIVKNNQQYGDDIVTFSSTAGPLAEAMYKEIPGFKAVSRTLDLGGVFGKDDKFVSKSGLYADSSFFEIVPFTSLKQAADFSLANPSQIAISEEMAETLFANEDPIGQTLSFNKNDIFTVTKVYGFPDQNITVKPNFVVGMVKAFQDSSFVQNWSYWGQCGMRTYASLNEGVAVADVNKKMMPLIKDKSGNKVLHEVFLYPITRLAVYNSFRAGVEQPSEGSIKYMKLFGMIGIIILVIACINFMNLSTARSERRAKEIGLKKVVGASRLQIFAQFMTESIITSMTALGIAVLILFLVVKPFGQMLDLPLSFDLSKPANLFGLLFIGLFCGILAGSYPSLYLSSFNPLNAIKKRKGAGASFVRKGLVVTQFAIAIVFMVAVFVVYTQINHVRQRDLGYDLNNVLSVPLSEQLVNKFDVLRQDLKSKGIAEEVSVSTSNILAIWSNGGGFVWPGKDNNQDHLVSFMGINSFFFPMMKMEMASGRNFGDNPQAEGSNVIINDAFAKLLGKEGKVGNKITRKGADSFTIIGITEPFLFNDLYGPDQPVLFFPTSVQQTADWGGNIYVRLAAGKDVKEQIKGLEASVKVLDHALPFEYKFLNETYDNMFNDIKFVGQLAMLFAVLAAFISCLGLFGLSAYTAAFRTKEIGVRKVLGASVGNISLLLSKDFLKLVLVSFIVAVPVAWYLLNTWLQDYQYRIELKWWYFVIVGFACMIIAFLTISFQTIKAAIANPVKSLRTE